MDGSRMIPTITIRIESKISATVDSTRNSINE